jgi:hypothetical protein
MKKLIAITFITIGLTIFGIGAFAVSNSSSDDVTADSGEQGGLIQSEVTGMVSFVKGDYMKVVDNTGEYYLIRAASPQALKEIKMGDSVRVQIRDGVGISIKKVEDLSTEEI